MPKLNDNLDKHATGAYNYSAASLDDLGATEYTLVTIVQDTSSSVSGYQQEMEDCIKEVVKACQLSPRADNLMIRFVGFADNISEIHGFKLLENCNLDDYSNCLQVGGCTALFDATESAIDAMSDYGKQLMENDYSVNGIVITITDGCDNRSVGSSKSVKKVLDNALHGEKLESLVTILVGVGIGDWPEIEPALDQFKDESGMTQFVAVNDANAKSLAKLADFVSKSISAQSQALGSGGPSMPLNLSF